MYFFIFVYFFYLSLNCVFYVFVNVYKYEYFFIKKIIKFICFILLFNEDKIGV